MDPIEAVNAEILRVTIEIQAAVGKLENATEDKDYWRTKELQLRKEKEQLRMEKEQLFEEKLIALRAGLSAGAGSAAESTSVSVWSALSIFAQLQMIQFEYSASKASSSRQGDDFKARLQTFYCNTADAQQQLCCMLLNVKLPMTLVTGAHLFKYCWKAQMPFLLGLKDINDARNGLLLFKPLKHAFDDSRICFAYVEEAGEPKFKLKLLDPALEDVKLWDYAETHNLRKEYGEHQIDSYAATATFGELQGKAVVFQNDNRPYRRCLRFQVVQALRRAKANGWLPADWTPSEELTYNSEDAKKRMDAWLSIAAQAPPPPPDSDSSTVE